MESQLTLRLPAALAEKLEVSARRLKRKRSDVVRRALEQFLETEPAVRPIERPEAPRGMRGVFDR